MPVRTRIVDGSGSIPTPAPFQLERDGSVSAMMIQLLNSWIQRVVRKINGGISFGSGVHANQSGNVDGQWMRLTTPATPDTEFLVPHGLGRIPVGYIPMGADKACQLYDSNFDGWNETVIYLKCDTASAAVRFVLV